MSYSFTSFPCPGKYRVTDSRKWYIPPGKTTSDCTYCEECYNNHIKGTSDDYGYNVYNNLNQCNCDYPKDYSQHELLKNDVKVMVINKKTKQPFLKMDNMSANLNGVAHFVLPTCSEYEIAIENVNNTQNTYLTFETGKVGDKNIVINDGQKIYYPRTINVQGFKTGTNDSFMFLSLSNQEKYEGKSVENENVSNILSIKVQKWTRQQVPSYSDWDSYGMGRSKGMCLESCAAPRSRSHESVSGGATVSGGQYVSGVQTTSTKDKFVETGGPVEFLIQLVCNQTDYEKYEANKKYHLRDQIAKRDELLKKKKEYENDVTKYEEKIKEYEKLRNKTQDKLNETTSKLYQYDHLGSTDQSSHLLHF